MTKINTRKFSSIVTDGYERAPSRAMLRAVGFKTEDFKKPQIGIASTWSMVTPCNMHIDKLAEKAARGVDQSGGKSVTFNTITVSDGISMGSEGMKYSLVSREVIADSVETVAGCEGFDGLVAVGGCDKNMPGCLIAMARLNRPSVFVYGGTILPGCYKKKDIDIVSVFEAVGAYANNKISKKELNGVEMCAIPGPGSCGGMYTANTMACAIEALGMSLPNSSAQAAISKAKEDDCRNAGKAVLNLLKKNICPKDILTKKAFENAITVVTALGGSTNAVLHLLAIAHAANVNLNIDDFDIDEQTEEAVCCPAGHKPVSSIHDKQTGKTKTVMPSSTCSQCEFRKECPVEKCRDGYCLYHTAKQRRLAGRRREESTDVFRDRYRIRSGIEGTNSGLKRRTCLGRLRVRGQPHVFRSILLKVAGWNILRAAACAKMREIVYERANMAVFWLRFTFLLVPIACRSPRRQPKRHFFSAPLTICEIPTILYCELSDF